MILFAHGFVPPGSPANSWQSQLALADGTSLPALVNSLGFGFAASGYSKQGLAILQGVQDTAALTTVIQGLTIPVNKYFVTGASEGGLIAAKLLEGSALYKGGLAVCGPLGDFQKQINYFGDVRVLFDYFFPGVLTSFGGSAVSIPGTLIADWPAYEQVVVKALNANPLATLQLLNTAGIPPDSILRMRRMPSRERCRTTFSPPTMPPPLWVEIRMTTPSACIADRSTTPASMPWWLAFRDNGRAG